MDFINNKDIVDNIKKRVSIFHNFYDVIRIIEPFEDHMEIIKDDGSREICNNCFNIQGRPESCNNCISRKSFLTNDTRFKYDYKKGKPLTVISTPIEVNGKRYIVEIIKFMSQKDLTESGVTEANALQQINTLNYEIFHDSLTEIYNRKYIEEKLPNLIKDLKEMTIPLSIVMCDLDKFKNINDTYGHLAGDYVLKRFAQIISKKSKNSDGWAARFGGEEFICVFPWKDSDQAFKIAEDMRIAYENEHIIFHGQEIHSTASFGIAEVSKNNQVSSEELIKLSDKKLYMAKSNGRNLVAK